MSENVAQCSAVFVCALLAIILGKSYTALDNTQYGLMYSWWTMEVWDNNGVAYGAGFYPHSPFKSMIIFPSKIETLEWSDTESYADSPSIASRTSDGLAVNLECSLQYQIMPKNVLALYHMLGGWAETESFMRRVAQSVIMTEATHYSSEEFFANRTTIAPFIEAELRKQFKSKIYSYVQFFQLQDVILPKEFQDSVKKTTLTNQEIAIYEAAKNRKAVEWQTELLKMEQHVDVRVNEARASSTEIQLDGEAKGQRLVLQGAADAAAILQKSRSAANASASQKDADARSMLAARKTDAATIKLRSLTRFKASNLSHYLQARAYGEIREALGSEEQFLEYMKVKALQNASWSQMSVNLPNVEDALGFMGLASGL